MAYKPESEQAPLIQATAAHRPGAVEWDGVVPRQGLKHLLRMSIIVLTMTVINLGCQVYLATLVSGSGTDYMWDNTPASAIWAAGIGLCAVVYMIFVTNCALGGAKYSKFHMAFALVGCGIACGFLLSGMVMSAITTDNLGSNQNVYNRVCIYFNSTGQGNNPPTVDPYNCVGCNPTYSSIPPRTCCCCSTSSSWDNTMTFYGVANCQDILNYGYPIAFTSSVLYGASLMMTFVICIVTCVVGCCRCYSCSELCGPFSQEGDVCCKSRSYRSPYGQSYGYGQDYGQTYGTHVVVAHPVATMPSQPSASYHVNAHGGHPPGTIPSSLPSLAPSAPVDNASPPIQPGHGSAAPPPYR